MLRGSDGLSVSVGVCRESTGRDDYILRSARRPTSPVFARLCPMRSAYGHTEHHPTSSDYAMDCEGFEPTSIRTYERPRTGRERDRSSC